MSIINIAEITADTKYQKAEDALNKWIKNPPSSSRVIEFTPELATYILTTLNHKNRPRKSSKIVQYSKDMADKKWLITGETIAFGSDGLLKDGQNRLAACVRSNTPFKTHVMFGIDPLAFAVMDTGANRSHSDVLSIMGVPNATKVTSTLKLFLAWQDGKTNTGTFKVTNDELRSFYVDYVDEDAMQRAVRMSDTVWKCTGYPASHVGALYYRAFSKGDEVSVIDFFEAMKVGVGKAGSPHKVLMKHITSLKANPSYKVTSHDYGVLINRAWYAHKNKSRLLKSDLVVLITDKLPAF